MLEEGGTLAELIPAVLSLPWDKADLLLATAPLMAVCEAKLDSLWPLWMLETLLYVLLCVAYTCFAAGETWAAWPCFGLAGYVGLVELMQLRAAACVPLLGDPANRFPQIASHFKETYNLIDLGVICTVFYSVAAGLVTSPADTPWASALTTLLLVLKLVGALRALEAFAFLISMLITTVYMMRYFALLLGMLIAGFAIVFFHLQIQLSSSPATDLTGLPPSAPFVAEGMPPLLAQRASISEQLWATYLLCITGDFDSAVYSSDPIAGVAFFLLVFIVCPRHHGPLVPHHLPPPPTPTPPPPTHSSAPLPGEHHHAQRAHHHRLRGLCARRRTEE